MPTMDYNILIHKKLSGQITDEELGNLESWLASDPANQREFDEIKLIWESAEEDEEEVTDTHFNEELLKLESAVQDSVRKEKQLRKLKTGGRVKSVLLVTLAVVAGYFITSYLRKPDTARTVQLSSNELNEIVLTDSSRVALNDSSSVSFIESSQKRELSLKGEALFEIKKDQRPFVIHAQGTTVSVLGTSFLIKAYPGAPVEVIVISGQVEVSYHEKKYILADAEKSISGGDQNIFQKGINENPNFNAWYTRRLEFNKTELRQILELIEELYHITFSVKEKEVLTCRFTGTFNNAKLENILRTLSFSMDIEFTSRIGNYYVVSGKGCVP